MKHNRFPRPAPVTFTGNLLWIWGVISFLLVDPKVRAEIPYYACIVASALLYAVCGIFVLRGADWARILVFVALLPAYVVDAAIGFYIHGPITEDDGMSVAALVLVNFIIFFVIGALLLSVDANYFFVGRSTFFRKRKGGGTRHSYRNARPGSFDY